MSSNQLRIYDNYALSGARTCLRYYYLRHVRNWTADAKPVAPIFGSSWHAAMDVLWPRNADLYKSKASRTDVIEASYQGFITEWTANGMTHPDELSPDDIDDLGARTPINALEMLHHYPEAREHVFKSPSFELLAVEEPFIVPLDPDDKTLWYGGRIDKRIQWQGAISCVEHKTSSLYRINGVFSIDWIDGWSMDDQTDGYNYSLHIRFGEKSGGSYVDGALIHKKVHDGFKLIPVDKQPEHFGAWIYDTRKWIDLIETNLVLLEDAAGRDTPHLEAFPRNRHSCVGIYGRCQYFDLCRYSANPAKIDDVPLGFKIEKWNPISELNLQELIKSAEV